MNSSFQKGHSPCCPERSPFSGRIQAVASSANSRKHSRQLAQFASGAQRLFLVKSGGLVAPRTASAAFSLIEIMIVMALLSVIVLGLMAMFNQTQRAFKLGLMQQDILESGRMATDLIGRELEQMTPCYWPSETVTMRGNNPYRVPNFYSELMHVSEQSLPGSTVNRSNVLQDVFFLTRRNQTWTGIGYFVRTNLSGEMASVGSLYRFETNVPVAIFEQYPGWLFDAFTAARSDRVPATLVTNNISLILEGVVNFRVRLFDTTGWQFTNNPAWWADPIWGPNPKSTLPSMLLSANLVPVPNQVADRGEDMDYLCFSNALPGSVEFELGVLEQEVLKQYRAIPVPEYKEKFYFDRSAYVHLFRQRIPIRNVDPAAYSRWSP